ncbi:MAG: hypothetical protein D6754_06790 [Alphaproteobacteria bacterium]|nr:MAG: hypothetical protein D6754_06790 [Alphaproteobacteria bacterium]
MGRYASQTIGEGFFGANFLAGRDSLTGTFADKAAALGATLLRYPGGGISEGSFDLANPDAMPPANNGSIDGLSRFLAHTAATGQQAALVIPTKRYADNPDQGVADLTDFLHRLKAGAYGDARGMIIEIGNEYYSGSAPYPAMTAAQYGELASRFASTIQSIMGDTVAISVQTGKTARDNAVIKNAFDLAAERDAVDMLSFHEYPWRLQPAAERMADKIALAASWSKIGVDADIFLSEWNVGSSADATRDSEHDYAEAQSSTLLEIATEALKGGVDYAAIWGVQQRTRTALGADEGDGRVWAPGKLVAMLGESLPGKRVVDLGAATGSSDEVKVYAFEDRAQITVFIAARDLTEDQATVTIDLTGVRAGIADVRGDRLSFTGHSGPYKVSGSVDPVTPELAEIAGGVSATVTLEADYEIVRLTFDRDMGDVLRQLIRGNNGDDYLAAGAGNDIVFGEGGNDVLIGAAGRDRLRGGQDADRLVGGNGDDLLFGEGGADRLIGANGDDQLFGGYHGDVLSGGSGDDRLFGSTGADRLRGDSGFDWLDGGMGADWLFGGAGSDIFVFSGRFGNDLIFDFNPGQDLIDLSGVKGIRDFDDLVENHLIQRGAHTHIVADSGDIALRFTDISDLDAANFVF